MAQATCRLCGQEKPISEFGKSSRHTSGKATHCLECNRMKKRLLDPQKWEERARPEQEATTKFNVNYWIDYEQERDNPTGYRRNDGNKHIKSRGT